jgi:hypothetical protein
MISERARETSKEKGKDGWVTTLSMWMNPVKNPWEYL